MEEYRLISDNVHGHIKVDLMKFLSTIYQLNLFKTKIYINFIVLPNHQGASISSINIKVSRLAEKIINTSVFKRLKSIKQLQAVHEVFPTGNHTRQLFLYESNSKINKFSQV